MLDINFDIYYEKIKSMWHFFHYVAIIQLSYLLNDLLTNTIMNLVFSHFIINIKDKQNKPHILDFITDLSSVSIR